MPKRRHLARESLEMYLVQLLMIYRRVIFIAGLFLLVYAVLALSTNPPLGLIALLLTAYLLLLGSVYTVTLYTARLAAWLGTLWGRED